MEMQKLSKKNRRKNENKPPRQGIQRNQKGGNPQPKSARRFLVWIAAATGTSLIGLLVTGILPKAIGQFINSAQVEDSLRHGQDIFVNESLINPDGPGVPLAMVIPGNYQPSNELIHALAHPMAAVSPSFQRQLNAANGVGVDTIYIRLVLQGNRNQQILILGLHPIQLQRGEPLNGVFF